MLNKDEIAGMLAENLTMFFPDLHAHFMCPTCLYRIPICHKERISQAHIVPKVAGGTAKTLLCTKCNSFFGSNQDKWFGELIRITNSDRPSVFYTNIKRDQFVLDDQQINGHWEIDKNGNFRFYWDVARNPPHVNKLIQQNLVSRPHTSKLRFALPILEQEHQINVGFLTAGYLMFFAMFGYSWVLQSHLDQVRKQIRDPQKEIIRAKYVASTNMILSKEPWIGFMKILDHHVPVFGFLKNAVLYPPMYLPDLYSSMGEYDQTIDIVDICPIRFANEPKYNRRLIVLMEDKVMIAPDATRQGAEDIEAIQFMYGSNVTHTFKPVSEKEFRVLKGSPLSRTISLKLRENELDL